MLVSISIILFSAKILSFPDTTKHLSKILILTQKRQSAHHLPASFIPSLPLILPPILLAECEYFLKLNLSIRLKLPLIHQLPIMFHPVQHQMLLNPVLRWIPMVLFYERFDFIISSHPSFILRHTINSSIQAMHFVLGAVIRIITPKVCKSAKLFKVCLIYLQAIAQKSAFVFA